MANDIPNEQNAPDAICLLRASQQIYSEAKRIGTWQIVLSVSSAVGGPVLSALFPVTKAWVGLYGAIALLVDVIFLEPTAKYKQETGAKIQETFDTKLYRLAWNRAKVGLPPDPETLSLMAAKHQRIHPDPIMLKNWYSASAGRIPLELARFVCQRANMRWDHELRRNFCTIYLIMLVALWVVGVGYSLAARYDMERFVLSVAVPLLPASVQLWRARKKQEESALDSVRCKEYLEGTWQDVVKNTLSQNELTYLARTMQDELYDRRRRSPSVPEWLYARKRAEFETQMNEASQAMAEEVLARTPPPVP